MMQRLQRDKPLLWVLTLGFIPFQLLCFSLRQLHRLNRKVWRSSSPLICLLEPFSHLRFVFSLKKESA